MMMTIFARKGHALIGRRKILIDLVLQFPTKTFFPSIQCCKCAHGVLESTSFGTQVTIYDRWLHAARIATDEWSERNANKYSKCIRMNQCDSQWHSSHDKMRQLKSQHIAKWPGCHERYYSAEHTLERCAPFHSSSLSSSLSRSRSYFQNEAPDKENEWNEKRKKVIRKINSEAINTISFQFTVTRIYMRDRVFCPFSTSTRSSGLSIRVKLLEAGDDLFHAHRSHCE